MAKPRVNIGWIVALLLTLLYGYWESQAEGNIRIDLLVIYPVLFISYLVSFWRRYRFYALLIAALLIVLNLGFAVLSYDLFDKHPG